MKNFKRVFENELREMDSSFLRKVFRFFIIDYTKELLEKVEKKLEILRKNAITQLDLEEKDVIYHGLMNLEEYKYWEKELYPYLDTDLDIKDGLDLFNKGKLIIGNGVLVMSEKELAILENRTFEGKIRVSNETYSFYYRYEKNEEYLSLERRLKDIYMANNQKWNPIYAPYTRKMYSIVIADYKECKDYIGKAEELFLGEHSDKFLEGYFPVWNLKKEKVLSTSDPAYKAEGYYEYRVDIGGENEVLIDIDSVEVINKKKDIMGDMVISTYTPNIVSWNLFVINKRRELEEISGLKFELVNNRRRNSFIDNLKEKNGNRVRTIGEIYRLFGSFQVFDSLKLKDYEFCEDKIILKLELLKDDIEVEAIIDFLLAHLKLEYWESRFEIRYE